MEFYEKSLEEIYKQFGTSADQGLTTKHTGELRQTYGENALQKESTTPWYVIFIRQFTGMLIYILVGAALISGFLGEWVDFFVILAILLINGVLGFIQEWRAQASIEALRKMASSQASVIRDGKAQHVDATMLVPGDILILETGDRIPADARLIEAIAIEAQEGALTGESVPVSKHTDTLSGQIPLGDQKNMVFSGTIITKGRGKAVVTSTGMKTQIGQIAHLIQETKIEQTPLQKNLERLGTKIGRITIGICAIIFFILMFAHRQDITLAALKEPFLISVSLAVAAVPEGLPIVVTIALAFGTKRMVRKHALIKRLSSVETLGSTTVICTDKTGTLTRNEMTVTKLWHSGNIQEVSGVGYSPEGKVKGNTPHIFFEVAALCNDAQLTSSGKEFSVIGDPTEGCLITLARKGGMDEEAYRKEHPRVDEIPFDSERKRMSTINSFGKKNLMLTKGAPDIVLGHCKHILHNGKVRKLTPADKKSILAANKKFAKQALRVLGFAYKEVSSKKEFTEKDENDLIFVGLAGMIDPPRESAKLAIEKCKTAGIRVVMITGDHKDTAVAIAEKLGMSGRAVVGKDLAKIDLAKEVEDIAVYARVNPDHKMQIIEALKKHGHVVAMTGDGVNDAPALKRADIGVAMGITGTDVAKESASMILTDDNFASIVNAVEEGRKIYTNIKKFVNYLLSSNFAEVLTILASILFFTHNGEVAVALTVAMILYMNLLTDSLPALALGVDPGDPKVMTRPPRDPKEPIITENMLLNIVLIGLLVAAATLFSFSWSLSTYNDLAHAQTMALSTLVILEIVRLSMIRRQYNTPAWSNKWLVIAVGAVFLLQLAVVYVPFMTKIFGTVMMSMLDWVVIIVTAAFTYAIGMIIGSLVRRFTHQHD